MPYDGCIGNILEFYVLSLTIGAIIYKSVQTKLAVLFSQVFTSFHFFMDKPFLSCSEHILWQQHKKWKQKLHVCAKRGKNCMNFLKTTKASHL